LLEQDCANETNDRGIIGEDAGDIGAVLASSRVRACTSSNNLVFSIAMTAWSAKVHGRGVPHSSQNLLPAGMFALQSGQFMN
jgi:hypothetical protein